MIENQYPTVKTLSINSQYLIRNKNITTKLFGDLKEPTENEGKLNQKVRQLKLCKILLKF